MAPPVFIAFTNRSGKFHFSFERFLENRIREKFGFAGTPIIIKAKAKTMMLAAESVEAASIPRLRRLITLE